MSVESLEVPCGLCNSTTSIEVATIETAGPGEIRCWKCGGDLAGEAFVPPPKPAIQVALDIPLVGPWINLFFATFPLGVVGVALPGESTAFFVAVGVFGTLWLWAINTLGRIEVATPIIPIPVIYFYFGSFIYGILRILGLVATQ